MSSTSSSVNVNVNVDVNPLIWFLLVDEKGNAFKGADITSVTLAPTSIVDQFRKAVKSEYDQPYFLKDIPASVLQVYANQAAFKTKKKRKQKCPLEADAPISGLGSSKGDAIYVMVPSIAARTVETDTDKGNVSVSVSQLVWFLLVDKKGNSLFKGAGIDRVKLATHADVVDFRKEVKKEFAGNRLKNVDPLDLYVFRSQDAFEGHVKAVTEGRTEINFDDAQVFLKFDESLPVSSSGVPLKVLVDDHTHALEQVQAATASRTPMTIEELAKLLERAIQRVQQNERNSNSSLAISKLGEGQVNDFIQEFELKVVVANWDSMAKAKAEKLGKASLNKVDAFVWGSLAEPLERKNYVDHLRKFMTIPEEYDLKDCAYWNDLLKIPKDVAGVTIKGGTDVVITHKESIKHHIVPSDIAGMLEIKRPEEKALLIDHQPQALAELLAASCVSKDLGVLMVLTDLNDNWYFYWLSSDSRRILICQTNRPMAKVLLDNMFKAPDDTTDFPEDFCNRGKGENWMQYLLKAKQNSSALGNRRDDEGNSGAGPHTKKQRRDSNSSEPENGSSAARSQGGNEDRTPGMGGADGQQQCLLESGAISYDVANLLDLIDMVDEKDQYEILLYMLMKDVLPRIICDEKRRKELSPDEVANNEDTVNSMLTVPNH